MALLQLLVIIINEKNHIHFFPHLRKDHCSRSHENTESLSALVSNETTIVRVITRIKQRNQNIDFRVAILNPYD